MINNLIITLLPKKDRNILELKNWRPITLLNQDYKLATKAISQRICKHLKKKNFIQIRQAL